MNYKDAHHPGEEETINIYKEIYKILNYNKYEINIRYNK